MSPTARRLAFASALALFASGALAQPRPFSPALTCGQIQGLIAARGAVVLSTSQTTYDRYVATRGFCQINEDTYPAWVPSRDAPQCLVYRCRDVQDIFD